jgi:hypothetical protein
VQIPEGFVFLQNSDYENNPASVKGIPLYNEMLNSIESYSIFDPALEIYNRLMQKASIIV